MCGRAARHATLVGGTACEGGRLSETGVPRKAMLSDPGLISEGAADAPGARTQPCAKT
jgi:hypothetical protein